jgi:hypothetical protein
MVLLDLSTRKAKAEMSKLSITEISYNNVVTVGGWVQNLQYPVSQADLDALCKRLPNFYNHMGELYLLPQCEEKKQCCDH